MYKSQMIYKYLSYIYMFSLIFMLLIAITNIFGSYINTNYGNKVTVDLSSYWDSVEVKASLPAIKDTTIIWNVDELVVNNVIEYTLNIGKAEIKEIYIYSDSTVPAGVLSTTAEVAIIYNGSYTYNNIFYNTGNIIGTISLKSVNVNLQTGASQIQVSGASFASKNFIIREDNDSIYYAISETIPDKVNIGGTFLNTKTNGSGCFTIERVPLTYNLLVDTGDKIKLTNTTATLVDPEYRNFIVVIKARLLE